MAVIRKMPGSADAPECVRMMELIQTQSAKTLVQWAVAFAKERYLPLNGDARLTAVVAACEAHPVRPIQRS